jgi:hypothetical protein
MEVIMKNTYLTVKVEPEFRTVVEKMAKSDRRSLADETLYLMEIGLKFVESYVNSPKSALGLTQESIPAHQAAGWKPQA